MPFFTRLRRASVFLLRGQEKGTTAPQERREQHSWPAGRRAGARSQEKATPIQRSPGIRQLLLRCAAHGCANVAIAGCAGATSTSCIHAVACLPTTQRDSGGSPTVHPWTDVELGAIHCAHPAGFPYVTLPLHRGPFYCASCAAKTKQVLARLEFALSFPSPVQQEKVPRGRMTTAWMEKVEVAPAHPAIATFAHPCAAQRRRSCRGVWFFAVALARTRGHGCPR